MPPSSAYALEFEKPLLELERQIDDLKRVGAERQLDIADELAGLETKLETLREEIYGRLTPMQRVLVARHPRRPYTLDYLSTIFTDFIELHGDRLFRDDPAIVGGWARLAGTTVMVIGHQKGRDTKENIKRNFGMPHPGGIPQGAPADEARRPLRGTGDHADRHPGGVSGAGRGGARPIRSAGPQHSRNGAAADRHAWRWSSAKAARAARWRSGWPTGS